VDEGPDGGVVRACDLSIAVTVNIRWTASAIAGYLGPIEPRALVADIRLKGGFQLVQAMLADQHTGVLAGRSLVREAARLWETQEDRKLNEIAGGTNQILRTRIVRYLKADK
jgi:alkylation response protein AidB-like acyl-CoA dehydrogenase